MAFNLKSFNVKLVVAFFLFQFASFIIGVRFFNQQVWLSSIFAESQNQFLLFLFLLAIVLLPLFVALFSKRKVSFYLLKLVLSALLVQTALLQFFTQFNATIGASLAVLVTLVWRSAKQFLFLAAIGIAGALIGANSGIFSILYFSVPLIILDMNILYL